MRKSLFVLALAGSLAPLTGCGPTFFSATGHVTSSGGPLDAWSSTPGICQRTVFDGDTSKLVSFSFGNPNANDPDREIHDRSRPAFPVTMDVDRAGSSYKVTIETSRAGSVDLTTANCKTIAFDTTEGFKGFAEMHKPLKGSLILDCNAQGSHITSDLHFNHCE